MMEITEPDDVAPVNGSGKSTDSIVLISELLKFKEHQAPERKEKGDKSIASTDR